MLTVKTQNGKQIKLDESSEVNRGGEGKILLIPSDKTLVAKIYHPGITPISQKKFQFLNKLDDNFVKPHDLLFDNASQVIGFTMDYLGQDYFPMSSIFNKIFCTQNGIDKKFKRKVIDKLIKSVEYAHKMQVVIGDFNGFNILINKKCEVKLIDVDAYQAPGFVHSGRLLEEVRDYYYQGKISENSDYFALATLSFNALSFVHPFKGMHSKYVKIADRMINKIPVFSNDSHLKVPKCYEPIQDSILQKQFERIFLKGERFLLSLTGVDNTMLVAAIPKPTMINKVTKNDLIITSILSNSTIKKIHFLDNKGIVITDVEYIIYDTSNKGYLTVKHKFSNKDWDNMFIGDKNVIGLKDNELWIHKGADKFDKITNIILPNESIIHQLENVLMIVGPDSLDKLYIDESVGVIVKVDNIHVFGNGFTAFNGLIHNAGGKQNVFFTMNNQVSIAQSPLRINGIYQKKNMGIIQYIDKQSVKFKLFKIKDLKMQLSIQELDEISNFAYKENTNGEGLMFMPKDGFIQVLRSNDFEEISQITCDLVSTDSIIENSNSGLILCTDNEIFLLNKK